jgi:hypothetical protein
MWRKINLLKKLTLYYFKSSIELVRKFWLDSLQNIQWFQLILVT